MTVSDPPTLIDFESHPRVDSVTALLPFLTEAWRRHFTQSSFRIFEKPGDLKLGASSTSPEAFSQGLFRGSVIRQTLLVPLQAGTVNGWHDPLAARAFTDAVNEYFLSTWIPVDGRLGLAAAVAPYEPLRAAGQIDQVARRSGVDAVFLPLLNYMAGHRHYHPIYRSAASHSLPIVFHPSDAEGLVDGAPTFACGVPANSDEKQALESQIAQSCLTSLVFSGVLERFPDLVVIFAEFGWRWLVPALAALDRIWLRGKKNRTGLQLPSEALVGRVFVSVQPETDLTSQQLAAYEFGLDKRVVFGSDFPRRPLAETLLAIGGQSPGVQKRIGWENAGGVLRDRSRQSAGSTARSDHRRDLAPLL